MTAAEGYKVRHGRTAIGAPFAVLSFFLGVYGLLGGLGARSGAIEASFPPLLALTWYGGQLLGAGCLLAAMVKPWPTDLSLNTANTMIRRLYLERAGLFVCGWLWQSYGFAAFGTQGLAGGTAAAAATIFGLYTFRRIREQFVDLRPLRAWIAAVEALDADTAPYKAVSPQARKASTDGEG